MYASVQKRVLPASEFFRFCGRAGGIVVMALWSMMVIADFFYIGAPAVNGWFQAALLAVVFMGYAIGWRNEPLGGALAVVGTFGFVVLNLAQVGMYPDAGAKWFAAPGICYLIAYYLDKPRDQHASSAT